jgi:hypothetical protein
VAGDPGGSWPPAEEDGAPAHGVGLLIPGEAQPLVARTEKVVSTHLEA